MSSISDVSSNSTLYLNYLGPDEGYAVLEQDGDDKPNVRGRNLSEAEANAVLSQYGLQVVAGQLRTVDGFTVDRSNVSALTSFGDQPPLPDVTGDAVDVATLDTAVRAAQVDAAFSEGALMWMALSTLAKTAMREMADAKEIRNLMQVNKRAAKDAEIAATEKQIDKMKSAGWFNFGRHSPPRR
jgi:hypothetical protein